MDAANPFSCVPWGREGWKFVPGYWFHSQLLTDFTATRKIKFHHRDVKLITIHCYRKAIRAN